MGVATTKSVPTEKDSIIACLPLYEYRCEACGARFEVIRKFSDPPLDVCTKCGKGPVEKLLSSPAFQFKGSGWYVTDYARKSESSGSGESASTEKGEKAEQKDSPAASDSKDKKDTKDTKDTKTSESAGKTEKSKPASTTKDT